jgi:hypothetical protein
VLPPIVFILSFDLALVETLSYSGFFRIIQSQSSALYFLVETAIEILWAGSLVMIPNGFVLGAMLLYKNDSRAIQKHASDSSSKISQKVNDEYLKLTGYTSVKEAQKDLKILKILFSVAVVLLNILVILLLINLRILDLYISYYPEIFIIIGCLIYLCMLVWKCWNVIQKTEQVTRAHIVFSILLAPLSWIWFYPQLVEPLEVIAGLRMPPISTTTR